jgi:predicted Zn-dependent protease
MGHHYYLPPGIDFAVRAWIRRHKRGLRLAIGASVLLVPLLLIGLVWAAVSGAAYLKRKVANQSLIKIPVAWEQKLGDAALAQIKTQNRFLSAPQVLEPLNRLAGPLLTNLPAGGYQFTLFVADSREINAFALPGGFIIFNRGLLERAGTAEEVQGVLAHEMAHVLKRHSLMQLAQNAGLLVAVEALQGNESRYLDSLVREGSVLLTLKFSRDHERAADDLGWELLERAQINPQGMTAFFAGLKAEADSQGKSGAGLAASFLSTHPTPQERLNRLEQKKASLPSQEFKSFAGEFKALQAGLGSAPALTPKP